MSYKKVIEKHVFLIHKIIKETISKHHSRAETPEAYSKSIQRKCFGKIVNKFYRLHIWNFRYMFEKVLNTTLYLLNFTNTFTVEYRLNAIARCKLSIIWTSIQFFWSLNSDIDWLYHICFPVNVSFYNYHFTTIML